MKLWNYFFDGNQTFKFQKNCNNISKSSIRFIINQKDLIVQSHIKKVTHTSNLVLSVANILTNATKYSS